MGTKRTKRVLAWIAATCIIKSNLSILLFYVHYDLSILSLYFFVHVHTNMCKTITMSKNQSYSHSINLFTLRNLSCLLLLRAKLLIPALSTELVKRLLFLTTWGRTLLPTPLSGLNSLNQRSIFTVHLVPIQIITMCFIRESVGSELGIWPTCTLVLAAIFPVLGEVVQESTVRDNNNILLGAGLEPLASCASASL